MADARASLTAEKDSVVALSHESCSFPPEESRALRGSAILAHPGIKQ